MTVGRAAMELAKRDLKLARAELALINDAKGSPKRIAAAEALVRMREEILEAIFGIREMQRDGGG